MELAEHQYRFVVQFHQSRSPHFDFRLERDGVFKSWAVPKGIPQEVGIRRLAIRVKDHDLDFGDFEGNIPEGKCGAGHIEIWDHGTYHTEKWEPDEIAIVLNGKRTLGRFTLHAFSSGGENQWLMFKQCEQQRMSHRTSDTPS